MCTIHKGDSESPCILVKDLLGKTHGYAALNPVLPVNEDNRASAEHEICYRIRVLANAILRDAMSTGIFNQGKQVRPGHISLWRCGSLKYVANMIMTLSERKSTTVK